MRAPRMEPALLALASLLLAGRGAAAPEVGATLPPVEARDVTGQPRRLQELIRGPTLLVAITERDSGDALQAWFDAADRRAPRANRVSIISIGVPFFVGDEYARGQARERVPAAWRHASLFDKDHAMARALGLREDGLPYAFAVSGDARILAVAHGRPGDPDAERVWTALDEADARARRR